MLGFDRTPAGGYRERIGIVCRRPGSRRTSPSRAGAALPGDVPRRSASTRSSSWWGSRRSAPRGSRRSGWAAWTPGPGLGLVGDPTCCSSTSRPPVSTERAPAAWVLVEKLRGGQDGAADDAYMDEAEHLADRIGVVVRGRLIAVGAGGDGRARRGKRRWCRSGCRRASRYPTCRPWAANRSPVERSGSCGPRPPPDDVQLTTWGQVAVELPDAHGRETTLEDVYLELIAQYDARIQARTRRCRA